MVDLESQSIQASVTFRMLNLQHELWHYYARNRLYPAFPRVLPQCGLIVDNKDQ